MPERLRMPHDLFSAPGRHIVVWLARQAQGISMGGPSNHGSTRMSPRSGKQVMTAPLSSPRPLLRMEGVCKRFGATVALDGVDLSVDRGEVLALVGENGAGKSTLMKVLSGAYQPDEGKLWLDGEPYRPRNPLEARRAGVAMLYQELSLAT